jgi:hypothetical protein
MADMGYNGGEQSQADGGDQFQNYEGAAEMEGGDMREPSRMQTEEALQQQQLQQ